MGPYESEILIRAHATTEQFVVYEGLGLKDQECQAHGAPQPS